MMENKFRFPGNLFRSKVRQQLLGLFFTNPKERYYVRQLQALIGSSVGTIHRELTSLETMGVLHSETLGNLRLFSVNPAYLLFDELKSIVTKTIGVEGSLREAVEDIPGLKVAFIYGSFASGEEMPTSDIDLFLVGKFDEDLLNKRLGKLEKSLGREINYSSMTQEEFRKEKRKMSPLLDTILKEPKILLMGEVDEL